MSDKQSLDTSRRVVVKIGSALLVDRTTGALRAGWLRSMAEDVARIKARGTDVILVSSGSIALGRGVLGLPATVLPLEQSQAAAAVGQIRLARAWEEALAPHAITTLRGGVARGPGQIEDMLDWAYRCPFSQEYMGDTAENLADDYGYDREAMDAWGAMSQERALAASMVSCEKVAI